MNMFQKMSNYDRAGMAAFDDSAHTMRAHGRACQSHAVRSTGFLPLLTWEDKTRPT